jgi:hypothetical protein
MHHMMRDQLEKALSGSADESALRHLAECPECETEFQAFLEQAQAVRTLRAPVEMEPRAGFYARVLERIEAQGASIWDLFFESPVGRRIAIASLALAVLLGVALISAERTEAPMLAIADEQVDVMPMVTSAGLSSAPSQFVVPDQDFLVVPDQDSVVVPDQDSVLANLVTYREQ